MKILGYIFLGLIALGVLSAIVVGVASISDLRRYLRIRSM
jgi:hypothetical protein